MNPDERKDSMDEERTSATDPVLEDITADSKIRGEPVFDVNESEERGSNDERKISRRELLIKAGWTIPVILAIGLPDNSGSLIFCGVSEELTTKHLLRSHMRYHNRVSINYALYIKEVLKWLRQSMQRQMI